MPSSKFMTNMIAVCACFVLSACNQSPNNTPVEIKPAPKLTNDATAYAQRAWGLMNKVEPLVLTSVDIEKDVRRPLRELHTQWKINVKMTDSVTEGKYALCRKAMMSLDIWARNTMQHVDVQDIQESLDKYKLEKEQCKFAIEHPELGNTSPK